MTPFNPLVLQGNLGILSPNLKPVSQNSLIEHENGQIQASKVGFELFDIIEKAETFLDNIEHQSNKLSIIQSSIGAIGISSVAGCVLSAVNLFQIIQVHNKLNRLDKKLENGFLDLKLFFSAQLENLLEYQQQQRLGEAYSCYIKGLEQLKAALLIENKEIRIHSLSSCLNMFVKSLSIYDHFLTNQGMNPAANLRCLECSWGIQSSISEIYCLQSEYRAGLHSYQELQKRILRDVGSIKNRLTESTYAFVAADLQYFFEHDMKLIAGKISGLQTYQQQKVFPSVALTPPLLLPETEMHNLTFQSVDIYLQCLLVDSKTAEVKQTVITSHPVQEDPLPLLQFCHIYQEIQDIMDFESWGSQIESLLKQYTTIQESGVYFFNAIPPKKLISAQENYAKYYKKAKPGLLFDNSFFGTATTGFLLTDKGLVSSDFTSGWLWKEIVTINLTLNKVFINQQPFTQFAFNDFPNLYKLFKHISQSLSMTWQKRATILRNRGELVAAQEAYQRALQLDETHLAALEGLLIVDWSFTNLQTYIAKLKNLQKLDRLTQLQQELTSLHIQHVTAFNTHNQFHYAGECNPNGQPSGKGIAIWDHGDYYEGDWLNGQREGTGTLLTSEFSYQGHWLADKRHGEGIQSWKNGDLYQGNWAADRYEGQGKFSSPKDQKYDGFWSAGQRHGFGKATLSNGEQYEGDWRQDLIDGYGTMYWKNGDRYQGNWRQGKPSGTGSFSLANGDHYEGNWVNGQRHSQGRLTLANEKGYYEGEWRQDQKTGFGTMVWQGHHSHQRARYEGYWKNDLPEGHGTMTWSDGGTYQGSWQRGQRTGWGTLTWPNGDYYEGEWSQNMRQGKGNLVSLSQQSQYQGLWQQNQPVLLQILTQIPDEYS